MGYGVEGYVNLPVSENAALRVVGGKRGVEAAVGRLQRVHAAELGLSIRALVTNLILAALEAKKHGRN